MKCSACSVENKDTAKFCKGCGAALHRPVLKVSPPSACKAPTACGFIDKPDSKFCPKCGELNPRLACERPNTLPHDQETATTITNASAAVPMAAEVIEPSAHSIHVSVSGAHPVAPPLRGEPSQVKPAPRFPIMAVVVALTVVVLMGGGIYYYRSNSGAIFHADEGDSVGANVPVITVPGGALPQPTVAQPVIPDQAAVAAQSGIPSQADAQSPSGSNAAIPQTHPEKGETAADRATLDKINNAIDNLGIRK